MAAENDSKPPRKPLTPKERERLLAIAEKWGLGQIPSLADLTFLERWLKGEVDEVDNDS